MVEIKERLKHAMDLRSISVQELANEIGVSYQAIRKVCEGDSKSFSAKNNSKVAFFLRINPDWLATGLGNIESSEPRRQVIHISSMNVAQAIEILGKALLSNPDWGTEKLTGTVSDWVKDPANERKKKSLLDLFSEQDHTGSANETKAA